jgi:hypothetical protein
MKRHSALAALCAACLVMATALTACPSDDAPSNPAPGTAGTGTAQAGGTGTTPPAGNSGSGGNASAGGGTFSCASADKTSTPAQLHAAALAVLVPKMADATAPCAFSSCHTPSQKKAKLVLDFAVTDLRTALVDVPSCEAANLKLVDPSGGDPALTNSWLWQKLTAPVESGSDTLVPNPAWGASMSCGQTSGMGYGVRMPYGGAGEIDASRVTPVLNWICAGAPGPQ